ncbi:hypothetical protein CEE37_11580 [candidate division LCP-89 bacterium B3_LCP]|uniref:Metalloprotease TldD/E N-terminal domain-containing protein n=1 Tax=candidate division LCP-89 bacterium B3_LCP TaxID=2012998 RepID=A0A532UVU0_UNCL8|nr:MAG: hypothetical protein CEE37_11580 [candidate division LCP-89 bacterium B3_LCP]
MDHEEAQSLVAKTLSLSDADETEVLLAGENEDLTRFSDNAISQNVSRSTVELTVKVHLGSKVGRATTDKFDRESLKRVVANAKKIAAQQNDNLELLPLYLL